MSSREHRNYIVKIKYIDGDVEIFTLKRSAIEKFTEEFNSISEQNGILYFESIDQYININSIKSISFDVKKKGAKKDDTAHPT